MVRISQKEAFQKNILTLAINEMLNFDIIDLNDYDNKQDEFDFIVNGMLLNVEFDCIGNKELLITIRGYNLDKTTKHFYVKGYLERQTGKYIMSITKGLLSKYVNIKPTKDVFVKNWIYNFKNNEDVAPYGFLKSGKFI